MVTRTPRTGLTIAPRDVDSPGGVEARASPLPRGLRGSASAGRLPVAYKPLVGLGSSLLLLFGPLSTRV